MRDKYLAIFYEAQTNMADPDQTLKRAASDQGMFCLKNALLEFT